MQRVHGIYLRPKKAKGSGGRKEYQLPLCKYGAACNRGKACIYRHERVKPEEADSGKVCLAYLSDMCPYGKKCRNRHPGDEEAESLISMFAATPCRFADNCKTAGCLYFHPTHFSADSVNAVEWTPSNNIYNNINSGNDPTLIPQQWPKQMPIKSDKIVHDNNKSTSLFDQASKSGRRNYTKEEKVMLTKGVKSVEIPSFLWNDHRNRNSNIFIEITDPLQRFGKVNETCPENCIDLHYIAKYEVEQVLNIVLPQYKGESNIWIITGTGHHKEGHQAEGVLFYTTADYLRQHGYAFKIGIDSRGFRGALYLERL
eukprot:g4774.t1